MTNFINFIGVFLTPRNGCMSTARLLIVPKHYILVHIVTADNSFYFFPNAVRWEEIDLFVTPLVYQLFSTPNSKPKHVEKINWSSRKEVLCSVALLSLFLTRTIIIAFEVLTFFPWWKLFRNPFIHLIFSDWADSNWNIDSFLLTKLSL